MSTEVVINKERPRKGCFQVLVNGETVLNLENMPRPFKPLRAVDIPDLANEIIKLLGGTPAPVVAQGTISKKTTTKKTTTKKSSSDDSDLSSMKVVDLRAKLKSLGLPVSGRKAELIKRLAEASENPAPKKRPRTK